MSCMKVSETVHVVELITHKMADNFVPKSHYTQGTQRNLSAENARDKTTTTIRLFFDHILQGDQICGHVGCAERQDYEDYKTSNQSRVVSVGAD